MHRHSPRSNPERGYVLLTLVFFVAVLAISLATILPSVIQEARRDREGELVHRGAQYARAVRLYYKKTGRYPAKIEDLENTNEIRFLRKRYKDPMAPRDEDGAEQDFKILRFGDPGVQLQQGAQVPAAQQVAQAVAGAGGAAALAAAVTGQLQGSAGATLTQPQNATDPDSSPADSSGEPKVDADGNPVPGQNAKAGQPAAEKAAGAGSETYGGGAMVGVVSTNRRDTAIREFNKKRHYYEWQFIYDPMNDRGGLPKGPWQPQTLTGQPPGQPVGKQIGQPIGNQPAGDGDAQPAADQQ